MPGLAGRRCRKCDKSFILFLHVIWAEPRHIATAYMQIHLHRCLSEANCQTISSLCDIVAAPNHSVIFLYNEISWNTATAAVTSILHSIVNCMPFVHLSGGGGSSDRRDYLCAYEFSALLLSFTFFSISFIFWAVSCSSSVVVRFALKNQKQMIFARYTSGCSLLISCDSFCLICARTCGDWWSCECKQRPPNLLITLIFLYFSFFKVREEAKIKQTHTHTRARRAWIVGKAKDGTWWSRSRRIIYSVHCALCAAKQFNFHLNRNENVTEWDKHKIPHEKQQSKPIRRVSTYWIMLRVTFCCAPFVSLNWFAFAAQPTNGGGGGNNKAIIEQLME